MSSSPEQARRSTSQQRAIERVFAATDHPLTPMDVLAGARIECATLGIATVYRTLKQLVESGVLVSVELPGEPARYERSGKPHHHHFHCKGCKRVFDIQGCTAALTRLAPVGFSVDDHEVVLYGRCVACAA